MYPPEVNAVITNIKRSVGPHRNNVKPSAVMPLDSILPGGYISVFEHIAAVVHLLCQGGAVSRHDVHRLLTHGVTVGRVQSGTNIH